ncbi:ABC transporter permease subunit [Actinomadura parmotrematis]|uniref:ABC transporter permease subunit n=1 Tax=Actinomadura parmotrematis TaxID=2864039 RepID=A0ABS7FP83_9ACTN|nr:ABC transporter permease subunit [Actinomadura parmotrematis]MBW8481584.1 ABC transporter permease subunit [Actinomadura parmotrematis]
MIWLTWRQFRVQAAVVFGLLAALALGLAVTGPGLAGDYRDGLAGCGSGEACDRFRQHFFSGHQVQLVLLSAAVLLVPAVVGLFWGAPLVAREIEGGTHRLAWGQTVSRRRWLAVKLAMAGTAAAAAGGAATLAVSWWSEPLFKAGAGNASRLEPALFASHGVAPAGYALFSFVLGVAAGLLFRRTLIAMAATLAVFAALQFAIPLLVRPHLMTPVRADIPITRDTVGGLYSNGPGGPVHVEARTPAGAWVLSRGVVDARGRSVDAIPLKLDAGACAPDPSRMGPKDSCFQQMAQMGYRLRLGYHPGSRFWTFQWIEIGVFALLTAALTGFCFWRIRRLS